MEAGAGEGSSGGAGPSSGALGGGGVSVAGAPESPGPAGGKVRKKRKFTARIPPCRVKKVMQADEEVGRMTQAVPVVLGRLMEHFVERLLGASARAMEGSEARTLHGRHLKEAAHQGPEFALLRPLLAPVPTTPLSAKDHHHHHHHHSALKRQDSAEDAAGPRKRLSAVEKRRRKREEAVEEDAAPAFAVPAALLAPPPPKRSLKAPLPSLPSHPRPAEPSTAH